MECFAKKSFSFLQDSAHLLEYDKSIYNLYMVAITTCKLLGIKKKIKAFVLVEKKN